MAYESYLSTKKIAVFVFLGVLVCGALAFLGDFSDVYNSLVMIDPKIILILVSLTLLNDIFRFIKWEYFLRVLDIRVPLKSSALVFFSGITMTITPGKIGEVLKAELLKQKEGVERRKTLVVIFAERLTDVIGLALLALLGLSSFFIHVWSILLILAAIAVIIFMITNERIFMFFCSIGEKLPVINKFTVYMKDVYTNSRKLFTVKTLFISTIISSISWFFECLALYILLVSLGASVDIFASTFIFSFSSIFGSILVLPGGLGAAEGSFVVLLMMSGVPRMITSVATIVIRLATLWFGVTIGLISLYIFNRSMAKKTNESAAHTL